MRWLGPLLLLVASHLAKAESCLSEGQLAAIIFGTSFVTLLLAFGIAVLLWCFSHNKSSEENIIVLEKAPEKVAYENGALELENKATEPMPTQHADKMTSCHSLKQKERRKHLENLQKQRSHSSDSLNNMKEMIRLMLEPRDTSPLGFNIHENEDGIFIGNVHPDGPAERSGNIFTGDKIKSLSVSFEGMPLEDATNILNFASPYKVKLELERVLIEEELDESVKEPAAEDYIEDESPAQPTFRSISLSSFSSENSVENRTRGGSWMSKQKHALPRERKQNTELCRPSVDSRDETLPEESSSLAASTATDSTCTFPVTVPPQKPPSMIPILKCRAKSPLVVEEIEREGISEMVERSRYTYSKPSLRLKRNGKVEFCERIEPKRKSVTVEFEEIEPTAVVQQNDPIFETETSELCILKRETELRQVPLPPHIEDVRIEKKAKLESPPITPIIERKLPHLPKIIDVPIQVEKNGAPLYIEQKGALRKTFALPPLKTNGNEMTKMGEEQRARLDANRTLLQRQQEELRALGILP